MHSNTTSWMEGQSSEWCGEFIDSGHSSMQALADRFGLTLVDLLAGQAGGAVAFDKRAGVRATVTLQG